MMLVSQKQYFEGGRSICRNPLLQKMFMRLGRAEKAGSGVDKIVSGWTYLGLPVPTVTEEIHPDYVVLTLQLSEKPDKKTGQENRTKKPDKKELRMEQIINFCREPKPLSEIMELIGLKHRENFMNIYINPLIDSGRLGMIDPNHPKSRNQMYVIKEN